jgi:hypothetical protein
MDTVNKIRHIEQSIERLEKRYDPENDTIPGTPMVTHTDAELLDNIIYLLSVVKDLQATVDGILVREGRHL